MLMFMLQFGAFKKLQQKLGVSLTLMVQKLAGICISGCGNPEDNANNSLTPGCKPGQLQSQFGWDMMRDPQCAPAYAR